MKSGWWSRRVHTHSHTRAPKSQLDVAQPLTSGCWNSPKEDTPHPKKEEEAATRWYEG